MRFAMLAVAVGTLAVGLTGCGATDEPVVARAEHFLAALEAGDGDAACADLAAEARASLEEQEKKPCAEAIGEVDLPTARPASRAHVYGTMAQVSTAQDTLFLSRYADGWRIVAAGCRPGRGEEPYTCTVEVG